MTGFLLFGLSGFADSVTFIVGETLASTSVEISNAVYPVFIIVGLVGMIASGVKWG